MANNKIVGNETLATYHSDIKKLFALKDGYYENMAVGLANNLFSNKGLNKTEYFSFQKSGNTSDIDSGFANMKSLKGNSVVFNQLLNFSKTLFSNLNVEQFNLNKNDEDKTCTLTGIANASSTNCLATQSLDLIPTHKYAFVYDILSTIPYTLEESGNVVSYATFIASSTNSVVANRKERIIQLYVSTTDNANWRIARGMKTWNIGETITLSNIMYFDLTQMFGAGKEPTSVEEFNRMFPKAFYEYNAGELMSCKSSKYKYIGLNQYNVLNSDDYIRVVNGEDYICNGTFTNIEFYDSDKNLISTTTTKSFKVPLTCTYVKVIGGNSSTCLYIDNGDENLYEDYASEEYNLPNVELRSVGNVFDEIKPNGTYIKRIGSRAYQEGDENDTSVLTDKTNTYYVLSSEAIEQKPLYQFIELTKIDANGTQEFDSVIPQGVNFLYQTNLKDFVYYVYDRANGNANNLALESDLPILYRHTITMTISTRTCCFTVYHSSNLNVDSIQDLTTLLNGTTIGVLYRHSNNNYYNKLVVGSLITNCYFVSDDTSVENLQLSSLTITLQDSITAINFQAK